MSREKNPNREKAFELYKEHKTNITNQDIAYKLNEKIRNIEYWRKADKWKQKYNPKGGAPLGNNNSNGPPEKNQNARTYGWYSKYYPTVARNLIKEAEEAGGSQLEILWAQIMTQWIAIIRAQKIMHVKNQKDLTKEIRKTKVQKENTGTKDKPNIEETYREEEYELQFAWDKHATFLNSQSRAMTTLTNMLVKYDEMVHSNWDTATEEQKLRVDRLKVQIENEKKGINSNNIVIFKGEGDLED